MRLMVCVALVLCGGMAQADEGKKIRVTGDRVSLRSEPNTTKSEVLERAMKGQEFVELGREDDWVAVQAPESLDFWTSAQYVSNNVVIPKKLNVRSGPSRNYNVVSILERGQRVKVRGEFNGWVKIAPPKGSRVWISAAYTEKIEPPKLVDEAVVAPPVEEKKPESVEVPIVRGSASSEELKPLVLVIDQSRAGNGRRESIAGVLKRANPGLYKIVLISGAFSETVCLVQGNVAQLEKFVNRSVLMEGEVYWAKDVEWPVLRPQKITPDPLLRSL